jgi:hypothetical protein
MNYHGYLAKICYQQNDTVIMTISHTNLINQTIIEKYLQSSEKSIFIFIAKRLLILDSDDNALLIY